MQRKIVSLVSKAVIMLAVAASAAHADSLVEPSAVRTATDRVTLTWESAGPVDVYVGREPGLERSAMHLVSNDDLDGRHEYRVAAGERPHFLLRGERDGIEVRTAERVVPLEAGSNFRDVGGYRTSDGKRVRWGLIYRTGAMGQLTDRDYEMLNDLGIRVFCDLRSTEERELAPTRADRVAGSRYVAVDYPASTIYQPLIDRGTNAAVNDSKEGTKAANNMYREWPDSLAPQYRKIFEALLAGDAPLAYNCSAGQDRTGVATALVLTALGVPRATILSDYHLSTTYRRPEFERGTGDYDALAATNIVAKFHVENRQRGAHASKPQPLYDDQGRARLLAAFDEIEARWGSVERYLDAVLHVDAKDVHHLRALYLE